jgi:hypothetical protein
MKSGFTTTRPIQCSTDLDQKFIEAYNKVNRRRLDLERQIPRYKKIEKDSDSEDDGHQLFIANPTDDIPRNKLTE